MKTTQRGKNKNNFKMSLKPSLLVSIAQKFSYIKLWHKVFASHSADVISISQDVSYQIKYIPIITMILINIVQ